MTDDNRQWFAGIDWASTKHDVTLADDRGTIIGRRTFEHSGSGLAEMAEWLTRASAAASAAVHVAIERPHGPVVEMLIERDFKVHAINPKQLDRFRDRFTVAGAKDDRRDADVLASALRTDPHAFRRLAPDDPAIIELREWSRMAEEHTRDLGRYMSRLREQLQRYFPAFLKLGGKDDAAWKLALLELAPTPAQAAHLPRAKVARLLENHHVRCHGADQALAISRAPPLAVSDATVAAASAHVLSLLKSIRLVAEQLKEANAKRDRLADALAHRLHQRRVFERRLVKPAQVQPFAEVECAHRNRLIRRQAADQFDLAGDGFFRGHKHRLARMPISCIRVVNAD